MYEPFLCSNLLMYKFRHSIVSTLAKSQRPTSVTWPLLTPHIDTFPSIMKMSRRNSHQISLPKTHSIKQVTSASLRGTSFRRFVILVGLRHIPDIYCYLTNSSDRKFYDEYYSLTKISRVLREDNIFLVMFSFEEKRLCRWLGDNKRNFDRKQSNSESQTENYLSKHYKFESEMHYASREKSLTWGLYFRFQIRIFFQYLSKNIKPCSFIFH